MRVLTLVIAALLVSGVAEAAPKSVTGVWVGKYICGQGITKLTLDIAPASRGRITATFNFGPAKENPSVPYGSYRMTGGYDPLLRRIWLKGEEWIEQPFGYEMVDLSGLMTPDGSTLKGDVPFVGCSVFEVVRQADLIA